MAADVFFIAGEASGDYQAALLGQAIRGVRPSVAFAAIGSERLRTAGADILIDSSEWGSLGPIAAIFQVPKLYPIYRRLDARLRRDPPKLLVPVDFGAFNLRLIERLRRGGYRGDIIYYIPPAAWLDRPGTARAVAKHALPLTVFAHQRDFYHSLDLPVEYFGHPLVSVIEKQPPARASDLPHVLVYPGSRRAEVTHHLPVIARAAAALTQSAQRPARFTLVAATPARERQIRDLWPRNGGPRDATIMPRQEAASLTGAHLAWAASGTAVLELALRGIPQVAFYAVSAATYRAAQILLPTKVRGPLTLPNLVTGSTVVPELLQHEFTVRALVERSLPLLLNDQARARQLQGYADMRERLGPPDALARIAQFIAQRLAKVESAA